MSDDSTAKKYQPVSSFDVSDENPTVVTELLRALAREMRDGFESLREEMRRDRTARAVVQDITADLEQRVAALEQTKRKAPKK